MTRCLYCGRTDVVPTVNCPFYCRSCKPLVTRIQYLVGCRDCQPWRAIPFDDEQSRDAWIRGHDNKHRIELGLRTFSPRPDNRPIAEPMLRHAWRWYWVQRGLLISPIMHAPLPRDGVLHDVHVFPSAALLDRALQGRWMEHTPEDIKAKGYALTTGRGLPPIREDMNIDPTFGSTVVHRYEAVAIFTTRPVRAGAYDIPVDSHADLATLKRAEGR